LYFEPINISLLKSVSHGKAISNNKSLNAMNRCVIIHFLQFPVPETPGGAVVFHTVATTGNWKLAVPMLQKAEPDALESAADARLRQLG
jgi:hypothetical protein